MICNWCKNEVQANNQFCPYCGKPLNNQNNYNEHNYNNNNNNNNNDNQKDNQKANIWLAILSWFIPLAGLIIFIVKKDKEPKTAKVSGICALISFILNLIIVIISFTFLSNIISNIWDNELSNVISDTWNDDYNYDNNNNYDYDNDFDNNYNNDSSTNDNNINDNQQDNNTSSKISSDWKKYEVSIDNQTIKLPTTYNELSNATGYTFKSAQINSELEKNYYTLVNMYKNDKLMLYTEVYNDNNENKKYTDCKITRITQTKFQVSTNGATKITFPGGLKAGEKITENELIAILGTPDEIKDYSSGTYQRKIYKYFENKTWTTTNNFIITIANGEIDEIQLDNR